MDDNKHCILPRHMCIYDTAPGGWDYDPATNAVLHSLPSGMARQLTFLFVHLLGARWVKYRKLHVPGETVVWGLAHNSTANRLETGHAYFHSEADKRVDFRDVEPILYRKGLCRGT